MRFCGSRSRLDKFLILQAAEKDFGLPLDRDSLSSAIVKQIRKGKRFVRIAPNTFGLKPS